MKSQYKELVKSFEGMKIKINYACKAFTNLYVLRLFKNLGSGLDTVSIPEGIYPGNVAEHFAAIGNKSELHRRHGLSYVRTYRDDGTVNTGSGLNVSDYNTPGSMVGQSEFQGIDQMGENDTLLLYNQQLLFN